MIEPIAGLPDGTLGFRARGELTRADYRERLVPPLMEAVESGSVRLLMIVKDVETMDVGARIADAKPELTYFRRSGAWERTALVTDIGWLRRACQLLGWIAPGELRLFGLAEEDEARAWVSAQAIAADG
jgi:SpoIIAA-like